VPAEPRVFGLLYSVYTRIVLLTLAEKGVPYEFQAVEIFGDDGVPDTYLEQHPFGRIPAFNHDGYALYETSAITRYIDEAFAGPALQPASARARARVNQIINVLDSYAYRPMVWDIYVERISNPTDGLASDEERIQTAIPTVERCLKVLSQWLADNQFLVTRQLTLADLHAVPMLHYLAQTPEGVDLLGRYGNIHAWLNRLATRTSVDEMARSDP